MTNGNDSWNGSIKKRKKDVRGSDNRIRFFPFIDGEYVRGGLEKWTHGQMNLLLLFQWNSLWRYVTLTDAADNNWSRFLTFIPHLKWEENYFIFMEPKWETETKLKGAENIIAQFLASRWRSLNGRLASRMQTFIV